MLTIRKEEEGKVELCGFHTLCSHGDGGGDQMNRKKEGRIVSDNYSG